VTGPRRRWRAFAVVAAVGAACGLLLGAAGALGWLERTGYDAVLRLAAPTRPDPRVVVVGITPGSLARYGPWPWPRSVEARLTADLTRAGARVIAYDLLFTQPAPAAADDAALAGAQDRSGRVLLAEYGNLTPTAPTAGFPAALSLQTPVRTLSAAAEGVGVINALPGPDGVMRADLAGVALNGRLVPSLDVLATARFLGVRPHLRSTPVPTLLLGTRRVPLDARGRWLIRYPEGLGAIPEVPAGAVLAGTAPPSLFRGRMVFVGAWAPGLGDFWPTPVPGGPWPGVAVHAAAIASLLEGPPSPAPPSLGDTLVVAAAVAAALAFTLLAPGWAVAACAALALGYFAWCLASYGLGGQVLPVAPPLFTLTLTGVLAVVDRATAERRDRAQVTSLFARHVGPEVVDAMLRAGASALRLGGIRRTVTILFTDIRGFTGLAEALQPEQVVEMLNRCFEAAAGPVLSRRGTIDKFIGDSMMALWNAPLDLPDHARQAVAAAREIQANLRGVAADVAALYDVSLGVGIGIHTGEAVVGNIGSRARLEYTAIGDAVNVAARLQAQAAAGDVLVSRSTLARLGAEEAQAAQNLGALQVKGRREPVECFRLRPE
jgi:adenylate cyclase